MKYAIYYPGLYAFLSKDLQELASTPREAHLFETEEQAIDWLRNDTMGGDPQIVETTDLFTLYSEFDADRLVAVE